MPLCKDRAAKALGDNGYSLVKYPRPNIAPCDVLAGSDSPLDWLGALSTIWTTQSAAPTPADGQVPDFSYKRSDEIKGSIGVKILQGLIKGIGGNVNANLQISSSLSFTYEKPTLKVIPLLALGVYLKQGDLDTANPAVERYLKMDDDSTDSRFYIVTETLRARKLVVRVTGANSTAVSVDVSAIQGLATGNASVAKTSETTSEITFDGNTDLTFAFKAFELGFIEGKWIVVGAASSGTYLEAKSAVAKPALFGDRPVSLRM
jgi:hypothetical protein